MLVELHCHSRYSDGLAKTEDIMSLRLGAVAITDHNTLSGYEAAKKIRSGIMLIPGMEVSSKEGHILALGAEEIIGKGLSALETIDAIHEQGAVAVAAHPFGGFLRSGVNKEEALKRFDAIEVLNGMTFMSRNGRARELAEKLNKPATSGSDAHLLKNIGAFACEIDADDVDGIINAIRKGKVKLPEKRTHASEIIMDRIRKTLRLG